MDPAHVHLIITHLPIFGCFLGIIVLVYGLWSKSGTTIGAAYLVFLVSSIGGGIAYLTGESAEELVEHIRGIAKDSIKSHEESAEITIIALAVLGIVSTIALAFTSRLKKYSNEIASFIVLLALICFFLAARTGYLGGKIRHLEIGSDQRHLNAKLKTGRAI